MLLNCDSRTISKADADPFYGISWQQGEQQLLQVNSQQLSAEDLKIRFRTSRERKSVLDQIGQMKNNCILQAHLQIAVNKGLQQNASMVVEDVFFTLSNQACSI